MGLVLAGGVLGFSTAVGGLFLGLPPWAALGIWVGSGPAVALAAIALAQSRDSSDTRPETAGVLFAST
jgi:hypothetical protein